MNRLRFHIILATLCALVICGCPSVWNSTKKTSGKMTTDQMFEEAEKLFNDKEYVRAVNMYERLRSAHPNFEKIRQVHLRIGDSYFRDGDYDKAAAEYMRFTTLFPEDPNVPRARYLIGMCYFKQIKRVDLDDGVIRRAAEIFRGLAENQKGTKWGRDAEKKLNECRKKLAAKEIYKANTYINTRRYGAARVAAERILEKYPKLGYDKEAKAIIKRAGSK